MLRGNVTVPATYGRWQWCLTTVHRYKAADGHLRFGQ